MFAKLLSFCLKFSSCFALAVFLWLLWLLDWRWCSPQGSLEAVAMWTSCLLIVHFTCSPHAFVFGIESIITHWGWGLSQAWECCWTGQYPQRQVFWMLCLFQVPVWFEMYTYVNRPGHFYFCFLYHGSGNMTLCILYFCSLEGLLLICTSSFCLALSQEFWNFKLVFASCSWALRECT